MSDRNFYRAFEDRYRGSRELIKSRLQVYLPFINPLKEQTDTIATAVDLGCGRGEWLELLSENDIQCCGVDLDEGMLKACIERGFSVQKSEAIAYLKQLPDSSQLVVSGFHIVEHILFEDLQTLVQESLRILRPGGVLILETPNPENIWVGCAGFYLDPTHQKPLPPTLLSFLPEHYGFGRTKILRLQASVAITNHASNANVTLLDVLTGTSQDYAVIAQKRGDSTLLSAIDSAFSQTDELSLNAAATYYHTQISEQFSQLQATTKWLETEMHKGLSWKTRQFMRSLIHKSRKYTRKSRQKLLSLSNQSIRQKLKTILKAIASRLLRQAWLKGLVMRILARSPKLRYQIRLLVHTGSLVNMRSGELSPREQQVFQDLKQAIAKK